MCGISDFNPHWLSRSLRPCWRFETPSAERQRPIRHQLAANSPRRRRRQSRIRLQWLRRNRTARNALKSAGPQLRTDVWWVPVPPVVYLILSVGRLGFSVVFCFLAVCRLATWSVGQLVGSWPSTVTNPNATPGQKE